MRRAIVPLCLAVVLTGCASVPCTTDDDRVVTALLTGDEAAVSIATKAIVAGSLIPKKERLRDLQSLTIADVTLDADDHFQHLGVTNVSDYFLCLLQKRFRISSRDILAGTPLPQCNELYVCEVCNDAVYPIDTQVRELLAAYWERHLACAEHPQTTASAP